MIKPKILWINKEPGMNKEDVRHLLVTIINDGKSEEEFNHLATLFYGMSKMALLKSVDHITDDRDRMALFNLKLTAIMDRVEEAMAASEDVIKEEEADGK